MQTNTHTQRIVLVRGRPAYRSVSGVFANACKNQSEAYWSTLLKTTENLMTACPLKALSCLTSCPWETVFCTLPFRHCLSSLSLQIYLSSPPCTLCPINWDTGNTLPISLRTPFNSGIAGGREASPALFQGVSNLWWWVGCCPGTHNEEAPCSFLSSLCTHGAAGQNLASQWCICNDTTKSSPSMERKHHPTGGQALNYNGAIQTADIWISCFPFHSEHCSLCFFFPLEVKLPWEEGISAILSEKLNACPCKRMKKTTY